MNAEAVTDWVRTHPAAAAAGGGAVLLALLWLHHRNSSRTASQTAGETGATTDGGGQYLVPYDGTGDYTQGDPATTNALTNILTLLSGLGATEAAQTKTLGTIARNTKPKPKPKAKKKPPPHKKPAPKPRHKKPPRKGGHAVGAHTGITNPARHAVAPAPLPPTHLRAGGATSTRRRVAAPAPRAARPGARLPVAPHR